MYVINGRIRARSSFADIAKLLEAGLGPIVRRSPGFRGYYLVDTGDRRGEGVLVFDTAADCEAVKAETTAWFEKNIVPLCEGEPTVTAGEVIVSMEAEDAPARGRPAGSPEARAH